MDLRQLAAEITARRLAKAGRVIDAETREQMITDCEDSLENIVNRQILGELEKLGKAAGFERVLDADGDPQAFLSRAIPNYSSWVEQAVRRAVKEAEEGRR